MKRNKLILSCISLLLSVLLFSFTVFGWFVRYDQMKNMNFKILQIDSQVMLYQANDFNFNGVPDTLSDENLNKYYNDYIDSEGTKGDTYGTYVSYSNQYYDEKYDFSMKDSRYALATDSSSNLFYTISIEDMLPSKIYTFKFELVNYSGFANNLYFAFDSEFDGDIDILKKFNIRIGTISSGSDDIPVYDFASYGGWTKFTTNSSYNGLSLIEESDNFSVGAVNSKTGGSGRVDLWLQISIDSDTDGEVELENFALPYFRITFEIPDNE